MTAWLLSQMLAEQIGAHAKWVGFFDLQQIGDLVKGVGYFFVVVWHGRKISQGPELRIMSHHEVTGPTTLQDGQGIPSQK